MWFLVDVPAAEEPVSEIIQAADVVVVVLSGLGPGEVGVRGPVPDEPCGVVEAFGHPAAEQIMVVIDLAGPSHRLFQRLKAAPVPFDPGTAQGQQERALLRRELAAQHVQALIIMHQTIIA